MKGRNPYTISFGRIPPAYIDRTLVVEEIIESFDAQPPYDQAIKLTGIRGTGKTVTLTAIERKLKEENDWIVIGLRPDSDIIKELVAALYSTVPFITSFVDSELNLSLLGIGVSVSKKSPAISMDHILKQLFTKIKNNRKKVLVTIDEARRTPHMVDFIQELQILIREEFPIFFIAAGLYEDIESLENSKGLTFFLRAASYEMKPLNKRLIANSYKLNLNVTPQVAGELADITKGYAFAYQALGKFLWDSGKPELSENVLILLDEALAEKVYNKIWSELSPKDKWFLHFIVKKETMSAVELLELTQKKHSEWSEPRKRLSSKGIIDTRTRGVISLKLPRFRQFVESVED